MEGSRPDYPYYGRPDYGRPGPSSQQMPMFSAEFKKRTGKTHGLVIIGIQIGLPIIVALVSRYRGTPQGNTLLYLAGFVITISAYLIASNLMPVRCYPGLKKQFAARMAAAGIDLDRLNGIWVAFSPDGEPRIYTNNYDWDLGFLLVLPDRLCFLGELAQFALAKEQVAKIRLGSGAPSLWGTRRIYIEWLDQNGAVSRLNFRPADATSMRQIGPMSRHLLDRLQRWQGAPSDESAISSRLAALAAPNIGEVPSQSPDQAASFGKFVLLCFNSLITSALLCFVAGLSFDLAHGGQGLYVLAVVFSVWVLQALPFIVSGKHQT
ncbi:MAG TPA: hypothetical protein VKJ45_05415 [Blastocatellia bacterium]|nr:hypothetical protein [Blastocatellia bacterium]